MWQSSISRKVGNTFVVHFQTENERINAYTLASTLVGLADAAKAANSTVNPGFDIEIVVEAFGSGSFRALVRAVYTPARNLFSNQAVQAIILNLVAAFIWERVFATREQVKVELRTEEVVIEEGHDRIIVPRHVYDATRAAEKNPQFARGIGRMIESIASDDQVSGVAFVSNMDEPAPEAVIPRSTLETLQPFHDDDDSLTRIIEENCDLQILRAILERGSRKWEFMWRGVRISAPVLDDRFYEDFYAHKITIAPGDELKVRLAIKQQRDPKIGVYANIEYQVVQYFEHIAAARQTQLTEQEQ